MNKENFLNGLEMKLSGLPKEDIEERLAFYNEIINDKIEDGLTEEDAVAEVGTVDSVVEQIMAEIPFSAIVKEKVKPKRRLKIWEYILIVLGSPVWLPLLFAAVITLLAVYITIWSLVITIYAADLTVAASVFVEILGIAVYMKQGNPIGSMFSLGTGIACAGLAILLFFASVWVTKVIIKATGKMFLGLKISLAGKEA